MANDPTATDSIHSLVGRTGGVITLPAGVVPLATPISWFGLLDVTVQGHPDGTVLDYSGPPTSAIIDIRGANNCTFRDFSVRNASAGVYAAVMVSSLPHEGDHGRACSACKFINIRDVYDGATVRPAVFASVGPEALYAADGNNDWHQFIGCRAVNYARAAYRVNGSQCHSLLFDGCQAVAYAGGQCGWAFDFGMFAVLRRCGFYGHSQADIVMAGHQTSLFAQDCNSEHSRRFLTSTGNGASSFTVTVDGLRWAGDGHGDPFIYFQHPGPLSVTRSYIEELSVESGLPKMVVAGACVLRLDRNAFACQGNPAGDRLVYPYGIGLDAKAEACTMTRPVGDPWLFFKIPADPTKPIR